TFGTLLSSQGTDASFETLSPVSPGVTLFGVSFVFLCFQPSTPFPVCFRLSAVPWNSALAGPFSFGSWSLAVDFSAAKPVSHGSNR
ncbi:MAG TPA: hypothetical protein VLH10_01905, partial [Yinghuangia sp.]|nr:hypothetical protein [Yinghuangia sp.]